MKKFTGLRKPLGWVLAIFTTSMGWSLAALDYYGYDLTKLPSLTEKNTVSIMIRDLQPDDINRIEDLLQIIPHMMLDNENFATQKKLANQYNIDFPYKNPKDQSLAFFTSEKMKVWVCEVEGNIVGFISCSIDLIQNPVNQEKQGFISLIGVSRPFQKQGIGSKLLKKSIKYYTDLNADTLNLTVQNTNEVAMKFYESHGFKKGVSMPGVGSSYSLQLK